jgi:hypothetical protein
MAGLAAIVPALTAGPLDCAGWINVVVLAAGVVMTDNASDDIPGWGYAMVVASAVSAVAVVLTSALPGGIQSAEQDSANDSASSGSTPAKPAPQS